MSVILRQTSIGLFAVALIAATVEAQAVLGEQEFTEFRPRRQRSETDDDRILASTLFADGRLMFRREDYPKALRQYERAFRYSNGSSTVLTEIVPLAFRAGRIDEAIRYARFANPKSGIDPFVLRRLAIALTESERFADAAHIYERTVLAPEDQDLDGAGIVTQFELGRLYYLTGQFEKASRAFDLVADAMRTARKGSADAAAVGAILKNPEVTYSVMAESYLGANRLDDAEKSFGLAYKQETQEPLLAFHQARLAEKREQYERALKRLQVYLDSKQDTAGLEPYRLLASLLNHLGKSDELLERLAGMRKDQPKNFYLGYHLADKYLEAGSNEAALTLYGQLMRSQPTVDAYRGLVQGYCELGRDEELLKLLAKTVSDLGDLSVVTEPVAGLLNDKKRLTALFERVREEAGTQSVKERRPACVAMALLALKAEQADEADEFFRFAAGELPEADAQVWTSWGVEMLLAGQHQRAIDVFQLMREKNIGGRRRQAEILFYLSGALAISEKYDEAIKVARRAADLSKGVPGIAVRPAWVLYLARRWDDAKHAYEEFLDEYDGEYGSSAVRSVVREAKMTLSNICVFRENHDEAIEWLEQVLDEFPGDIGALNDLGYLWADQGLHLERSLRMARIAADAEPENVAYLDSVGWALYRLERFEEAAEQLTRAAEKDDPDPVILEHLGDALLKLGDIVKARNSWQRAVKLLEEDRQADRKRIETKLEQYVLE